MEEKKKNLLNICMKSGKFSLVFTEAHQHGCACAPETVSAAESSTGFLTQQGEWRQLQQNKEYMNSK